MRRILPALLILIVIVGLPALTMRVPYISGLLAYAAVLGLLGLGINISSGYLGYVSFGHAAFFGLGAYTAALLGTRLGMSVWLAIPLAAVPGAALGALVGVASMRVKGPYFAIATLVSAEILRLVALNWASLTRGPLGIIVPRPRLRWVEALGPSFGQLYLGVALLTLAIVLVGLHNLLRSPYGRAWIAIRDAAPTAESIGIPTVRHRVFNVALSGAVTSVAGALLVPKILVVSPDLFGVTWSATALLIMIMGGRATLAGPVIGGLVFAVLPELLRAVDDYRLAVFAVLLLVVIRLQPDGILALLRLRKQPRPATMPLSLPGPPGRQAAPAGLAVRELSRNFGGLHAVESVSFDVAPGEMLGLIGPNGAGKTTCLSLLSGFIAPSAGTILFDGQAVIAGAPHRNAMRGLVRTFQYSSICSSLTALDNVLLGTHLMLPEGVLPCLLGTPAHRRREALRAQWALQCLQLAKLEHRADVRASRLSYGEQRMVSVAAALAAQPRILLLDEPAAGLNHTEANELAALLRTLRDDGLTVVIVDHNLRMMMALCDRVVVLHGGRKLADGPPAAVTVQPDVVRAYLGTRAKPEPQVA